ncbi:sulfatase-like hydrolase/transferase, partial [Planctomycetota bacterium]
SPVAAAMIKSLDDTVGRVVDKIRALGIEKNTLIVFTSDNGGLSYAEDGKRPENTSNYPLRERKGSEFDGGLRVPFIFSWPGHISAQTLQHEPIQFIDLYPTFLQLAGAPQPDHVLDGVDLSPILFDAQARLKTRELFWYLPFYSSFNRPSAVVRRNDWKLIHLLETGECELYHTGEDIGEQTNISSAHPELVHELKTLALNWLDETDAPRMVPNPEYTP